MKVSSNSYNAIVNIYSSNVIFDEAYKKFREELNKISKEMKYTITDKISPFLTFVSDIKLNKLFINITSSNSVFFSGFPIPVTIMNIN